MKTDSKLIVCKKSDYDKLIADHAELIRFVKECAEDRDDCISGGFKRKAKALLETVAFH